MSLIDSIRGFARIILYTFLVIFTAFSTHFIVGFRVSGESQTFVEDNYIPLIHLSLATSFIFLVYALLSYEHIYIAARDFFASDIVEIVFDFEARTATYSEGERVEHFTLTPDPYVQAEQK